MVTEKLVLVGPRGVKLFLNCEDAFALLSRLTPKIKPFTVLSEAESLWKLPGFIAFAISLAVA